MLRFHELQQNPVSVTCPDESGASYNVVVMRLREGIVKMTCQCQQHSQQGWCNHFLMVFADQRIFKDSQHREAFDRLVGSTYLEEAAVKLISALDAFAVAYRKMKSVRPSRVDRDQLRSFAEQAHQAGSTADDLAIALETFINEAAARRNSEGRSGPARPTISREKMGALDIVRRALAKDLE